MTDNQTIARWLDLLIEQTEFGNVQLREVRKHNGYHYQTGDSYVTMQTRDGDGMLPYWLSVGVSGDEVTHQWLIWNEGFEDAGSAPEWISGRGRKLWDAIKEQFASDPIQSMLKELEEMPPF